MFGSRSFPALPVRSLSLASLALGLTLSLGTGAARAATVQAGLWPGSNLQNVDIKLGTDFRTVSAGTLSVKIDGGPLMPAYCVDLYHVFSPGDSWAVNVRPIADLVGSGGNPPAIGNGGGGGWLFQTYAGVVSTDNQRSALQVAIWEMTYDGPTALDLNSGFFQMFAPPTIKAIAAGFLAAYPANATGDALWIEALSHPNGRNQGFVTAVPEPAALALVAPVLALAGACGLIRKGRRA